MRLVEVEGVERRGEGVRVERREVVVVVVRVLEIRAADLVAAERLGRRADPVDGGVDADVVGVVRFRYFDALGDLVPAAPVALPRVYHAQVDGLVDGLDAVGVVVRHLRVVRVHDLTVYARVNEDEGVQVEDVVLAVTPVPCAVFDLLILLFEEGKEGRTIPPAV